MSSVWARVLAALSIGALCALPSVVAANTVVVLPGDPGWFTYDSGSPSGTQVTGANPRSGFGSHELTRASGTGSFAGTGTLRPLPGFGRFGDLSVLSFDWFIDPVSGQPRPPIVALRVYPYGDSRSFFLTWDACSADYGCGDHPVDSWETTSLIGHLSIEAAEGNTPPPSLADIPADAPIVGVDVRVSYANGAWPGTASRTT